MTYNTHLEAKVGEQNRAAMLLREWFPKVIAVLKPFEDQKVINVGGCLNQKVLNAIKALNLPHNQSEQIWVSTGHGYSVSLHIQTCGSYKGERSADYCIGCHAEVYAIVADIPHGTNTISKIPNANQCPNYRCDYTVQEVLAARAELKAAQKLVSEAQSKLQFFGEHDNH